MPNNNYKYHMTVRWPATCRNRSYEILKERPDLVEQMNHFRQKVDRVCKLILRKGYRVDSNHDLQGVNIWLESGQDVYDFIIRQPEFEWEIVPELSTVNRLTGELRKWEVVYTPSGITIA
jgi:hypothetical protein